MNYHPDDFLNLVAEVEDQGGAHLTSDTCKPTHFRLNLPIDEDNPQGPKASKRISTTGCHRRAKFLVPLLSDEEVGEFSGTADESRFDFDDDKNPVKMMSDDITPALVKVCAVDDSMGLWPRYQSAMLTGESFEPTE